MTGDDDVSHEMEIKILLLINVRACLTFLFWVREETRNFSPRDPCQLRRRLLTAGCYPRTAVNRNIIIIIIIILFFFFVSITVFSDRKFESARVIFRSYVVVTVIIVIIIYYCHREVRVVPKQGKNAFIFHARHYYYYCKRSPSNLNSVFDFVFL